ncbi:MAG: 4Fe-4S binding protein [Bacilli bacterium]|nr:4Fe-4S binding protein [Bacilli bacterium]MDD4388898.1 4Fe-4S binding protein [Bacilli bacterium]
MLDTEGIAPLKMIKERFPDEERLVRAKAIVECYEEIPCNPCSTSCPTGAITIGEDINNLPKVDFEKCSGCGLCIDSCPGLAIFVCGIAADKARFKIPYEFLPSATAGEVWLAVDRAGTAIGPAYIEKVITKPHQDRTVILQVTVDRALLYRFITVRRPDE